MTRPARSPGAPLRRGALLLAAALAACGEGLPFREPLEVVALSGARVAMTGTSWRACTDDGAGGSQSYQEIHGEEGSVTFLASGWEAPGCAGAETPLAPFTAYAEAHGDATVTWSGTPPAGLPETVPATRVLLQAGGYGQDVYLVDDTVTPRILYTGNGVDGAPRDADGWPTQLRPVPEVEQ